MEAKVIAEPIRAYKASTAFFYGDRVRLGSFTLAGSALVAELDDLDYFFEYIDPYKFDSNLLSQKCSCKAEYSGNTEKVHDFEPGCTCGFYSMSRPGLVYLDADNFLANREGLGRRYMRIGVLQVCLEVFLFGRIAYHPTDLPNGFDVYRSEYFQLVRIFVPRKIRLVGFVEDYRRKLMEKFRVPVVYRNLKLRNMYKRPR